VGGFNIGARNMKIEMSAMNAKMIEIDKIYGNNYNPNSVAKPELDLLIESIKMNGFCFAIIVMEDGKGKYVIIDGYHRHLVMKKYLKQKEIPCVVLNHDISERMEATIQFNRARGTHAVVDMSKIVAELKQHGLKDTEISKKLGMDLDEVFRLKQMSGLKEAFQDIEFSNSWDAFQEKYDI
jgi:ParB-like chromosome segregation protein Spo0J